MGSENLIENCYATSHCPINRDNITLSNQKPIAGRGDYRIYPDTAWSIELAALAKVPEWGGAEVRFPLEVDGFWNGSAFRWIWARPDGYDCRGCGNGNVYDYFAGRPR